MTWQPEVDELHRREELARKMGGAERVQRQTDAGRLTVRKRIDELLDAGSFEEWGALAGFAKYGEEGGLIEFTPANNVVGTGRIEGRERPWVDRLGRLERGSVHEAGRVGGVENARSGSGRRTRSRCSLLPAEVLRRIDLQWPSRPTADRGRRSATV